MGALRGGSGASTWDYYIETSKWILAKFLYSLLFLKIEIVFKTLYEIKQYNGSH